MPNPDMFGRGLLESLEFELNFLEQGGYGRSVHNPHLPQRIFLDSPTCLNYGDLNRTFPCDRCALFDFVPQDKRSESVPCHHIPLTPQGDTIESLTDPADDAKAQEALKVWLRKMIAELKLQQAKVEAVQTKTAHLPT